MLKVSKNLPIYVLSASVVFFGVAQMTPDKANDTTITEISNLRKDIWELQNKLFRYQSCQYLNYNALRYKQPQDLRNCFRDIPTEWQISPEYRKKND